MFLKDQLISYTELLQQLPSEGNHINAHLCRCPIPDTGTLPTNFSSSPEQKTVTTTSNNKKKVMCDCIVLYQAFNSDIARYAVEKQSFLGAPGYSTSRMTWVKTSFMWMMYRSAWAGVRRTDPNQARILAICVSLEAFDEILRRAVSTRNKQPENKMSHGPQVPMVATAAAATTTTTKEAKERKIQEEGTREKDDAAMQPEPLNSSQEKEENGVKSQVERNNETRDNENTQAAAATATTITQDTASSNKQVNFHRHDNGAPSCGVDVRIQWDPDHTPNGSKISRRAIQLGVRGETLKSFLGEARESDRDHLPWILQIEDITDTLVLPQANAPVSELQVPVESCYVPEDTKLWDRIDLSVGSSSEKNRMPKKKEEKSMRK